MFQVETMPQSIVDMRIIVLKPRLDLGDVKLIEEKIKPRLFSKFGFKPKSEDLKLLGSEIYFEPYLIIGGKYVIDYCRKHVFKVNVTERTTKVFIAGQEFNSEQSDPKKKNKIITMTGQENAHYERQTYFILDRMKREIPTEKLPISPFDFQNENFANKSNFKSIQISDEFQIEFLKTKIAQRPSDVAEILKEVFDVTERTIAYYPMYQLVFENLRNRTEASVTINGVTGEIVLNGAKKLAIKTIVAFPESTDSRPVEITAHQGQTHPVLRVGTPETDETKIAPEKIKSNVMTSPISEEERSLGFPLGIPKVFTKIDEETAIEGDVDVPSGATIKRDLIVRGTLRIGDNCKIHGKLEAMKNVAVGVNTLIYGDLISGGNVEVGAHSIITGFLQAAGCIQVSEQVTIEGGLRSTPLKRASSGIQLDVVEVAELS
jgi:cytoskeletal protein CcmA (bactofilin family)